MRVPNTLEGIEAQLRGQDIKLDGDSERRSWPLLWEYCTPETFSLLDPLGELTKAALDREAENMFPDGAQSRIWALPRTLEDRCDYPWHLFTPQGDRKYLNGWLHLLALDGIKALIPDPPADLAELMRWGARRAQEDLKLGIQQMTSGEDVVIVSRLRRLAEAAAKESRRTGKSVRLFGENGFAEGYSPDENE